MADFPCCNGSHRGQPETVAVPRGMLLALIEQAEAQDSAMDEHGLAKKGDAERAYRRVMIERARALERQTRGGRP